MAHDFYRTASLTAAAGPSPWDRALVPEMRLYASEFADALPNAIANPTIVEAIGDWDMQCMLTGNNGTQIALYNTCKGYAETLGRRMFPGFRILMGADYAAYCDVAEWQERAEFVYAVADLRTSGEYRIGLDFENYGYGGPTVANLASVSKTVEEMQVAMAPFIAALKAVNAIPVGYPANDSSGFNDMLYLATQMGAQMQFNAESTFLLVTTYGTARSDLIASQMANAGFLRAYNSAALVRAVVNDDLFRRWGETVRASITQILGVAPWIYDNNRLENKDVWFTEDWYNGLTMHSANDVVHHYHAIPGYVGMDDSDNDNGVDGANVLQRIAGTASTQTTSASNQRPAWARGTHYSAQQLRLPSNPSYPTHTYAGFKIGTAASPGGNYMPASPYTMLLEFSLPTFLAADAPIMLNGNYNGGYWQVSYNAGDDKIYAQLRQGASILSYELIDAPARDTRLRVLIGRDGDDWALNETRVTISSPSVGTISVLVLGAGHDPVTPFGVSNDMEMCDGIEIYSLCEWHRLLTEAEASFVLGISAYAIYPFNRGDPP